MFLLGARSLAATGTYEVAQRIQSAGAMGTTAVATVFMPRIAMSVTRRGRLVALVLEAAAVSAVLPTLLLGFLLVLGEQRIVDLLGPEYQGTWGASVILVVATLINALTSATSNVLMFGGRERLFMVISGAQLVLVVGGAWLLGTDTAVGMAWWMLIGELLRSGSMVTGFLVHLRGLQPRHRAD
jgi:O-antigen/teichoic acid export membrane protein